MKLQFPPGWYRSPDWWAGVIAAGAGACLYLDVFPPHSAGWDICAITSMVLGAGAAITSQMTTAGALQQGAAQATQEKVR